MLYKTLLGIEKISLSLVQPISCPYQLPTGINVQRQLSIKTHVTIAKFRNQLIVVKGGDPDSTTKELGQCIYKSFLKLKQHNNKYCAGGENTGV